MNRELVENLVNAILYEGHILYPYRASSRKNRHRFPFGRVYPRDYSVAQNGAEACEIHTECLLEGWREDSMLTIRVSFLQPMAREIGVSKETSDAEQEIEIVPELRVDGVRYQTWHEATERCLEMRASVKELTASRLLEFRYPATRGCEPIPDREGKVVGIIQRRQTSIEGRIEASVERLDAGLLKVRVHLLNTTPVQAGDLENGEAILMRTFASTHALLHVGGEGRFISLLEPPSPYAAAAAQCGNRGVWPVLVGDDTIPERDTILSSPIILYDYPKIAPESPGDLFDGTEIDEILTLRIMTMTDEEKSEMRHLDAHARRILERTEGMSAGQLIDLHGVLRDVCPVRSPGEAFFNPAERLESAEVGGVMLKAGDRVRLAPKNRADVMDIALAGRIGIIEAVEHDVENRVHFAVVIEDDPGRDLGMTRYPGHRFFFGLDEVEPLEGPS